MIDKGANPFTVRYSGHSHYGGYNLGTLSNLPTEKSIYFTIRPIFDKFECKTSFLDPWFYKTGIFDGKFNSVIGMGASGTVLSGEWCGEKAAFKFVDIGDQEHLEYASDNLKVLNEKLSEMTSIQETKGSRILSFYGHYR